MGFMDQEVGYDMGSHNYLNHLTHERSKTDRFFQFVAWVRSGPQLIYCLNYEIRIHLIAI